MLVLSIHLMCWLDLEQYRRTHQKDKAVRQERSSHIVSKYLNKKYFFGPDSPATTEEQNDVGHMVYKAVYSLENIPILLSHSTIEIELLSQFCKGFKETGPATWCP